jgi:asparagine synthase (glutamine-hydrolysing)
MCGLAGFVSGNRSPAREPESVLTTMGQALRHRGPDAGDVYWDGNEGVGLAHRRLAIQDLSSLGAQPMHSASGRFSIVFNGEIYNFKTLRQETEAAGWCCRGHSDTEVLLGACEAWGVEAALPRLAGMFAFAIADWQRGTLWLARDRMGEKPLYYGHIQGQFVFASELTALESFPGFEGTINRDALTLLLRHNYIPAPHSIYTGIAKLPPGHCLCLDLRDALASPQPKPYWDLSEAFRGDSRPTSREEAVTGVENRLSEVVREQMVADVPLGAFLSGGIDSATITAVMQQHSSQRIKTFTIGFRDPGFNEAEHAAAVARHLGTDHTELYVGAGDALELVPRLPAIFDEPFGDSSLLPTFMVSRMTREHVTVALSGDGGDELFAGYARYQQTLQAWRRQQAPGFQDRLANALLDLPDTLAATTIRALKPAYRRLSAAAVRDKLTRERSLRRCRSLADFYRVRVGYWSDPASLVQGGSEPDYALTRALPPKLADAPGMSQLQWLDLNSYLPDDILAKVDRAAMAVSLETRVPLLDHRVVSYALGLPPEWNRRDGQGKAILRDVLYRYVPPAVVDRPKQGFAVPVAQWLRGELRDWAEALLAPERLAHEGYWNPAAVQAIWSDHVNARADYSFHLWGILMFQAWLEQRWGCSQ